MHLNTKESCNKLPNYAYYLSTHMEETTIEIEKWHHPAIRIEVNDLLEEAKVLLQHCPCENMLKSFAFMKKSMYSIEVEEWLYIVSLLIEELKSDIAGVW